jgi:hypothetical protein
VLVEQGDNDVVGTEKNLLDQVSIYPNPATDEVIIDTKFAAPTSIEITDCRGANIYQDDVTGVVTLSTRNWPKGLFIVCLRSKNKVEYKKLMLR